MCAIFESKELYLQLADSPEQDTWWRGGPPVAELLAHGPCEDERQDRLHAGGE